MPERASHRAALFHPVTVRLGPPPNASGTGSAEYAATIERSSNAVYLPVSLVDVNDDSHVIATSFRLHDGKDGTTPAALWRSFVHAAALVAGLKPREPLASCTVKTAVAAMKRLDGCVVALAIDLYKPGPLEPILEIAGLYARDQPPKPAAAAPPPPAKAPAKQQKKAAAAPQKPAQLAKDALAAAAARTPGRGGAGLCAASGPQGEEGGGRTAGVSAREARAQVAGAHADAVGGAGCCA